MARTTKRIHWAKAWTGGAAGALDKIDGNDLIDLDAAIVVSATMVTFHSLDDDASGTESAPAIINPDSNKGTKSWILTGITVPNTGLHILDTNASHDLIIAPGSDLSADRTLTITTGDANRTLTLNENFTISDGTNITLTGEDAAAIILMDNANFEVENTNATQRNFKITSAKAGNTTLTLQEDFTIGDGNAGTITFGNSGDTLTINETMTLAGASGKTLTLNESLTVGDGNDGTITFGNSGDTLTVNETMILAGASGKTLTLNESFTLGDGYDGTLTFGASGDTLTVNESVVLDGASGKTLTLEENLTIADGTDITITGATAARSITLNENLTIGDGTDITITGVTAARTLTLNENLTIGDGYNGTITFSADAKILTIDETATLSAKANLASPTFTGSVTIPETSHDSDPDKFLCTVSGVIKYRTGANVLSDIGAAAATHATTHAVGGADTIFPADPDADKVLMWDDSESALAWSDAGTGDVTAAANITDHRLVRGDGGAKGIQQSGITADDSDNLSGVGTIGCGTITIADGSSLNLQEDITFSGATTVNLIKFPDNLADALSFKEGANAYLTFVTTNTSEAVKFGKNLIVPDSGYIGSVSAPTLMQFSSAGTIGVGTAATTATLLYFKTANAQSATYEGVAGVTYSDATDNYGVGGYAVGDLGSYNLGVFGQAKNASSGNYHFYSDDGDYCSGGAWHDSSHSSYKKLIKDLTEDNYNRLYELLEDLNIKSYRHEAEIPVLGRNEKKMVKKRHGREEPEPIYDDPEKAPERFGLIADDFKLPSFLASPDKRGLSGGRLANYALICIKQQKRLIETLVQRIEVLESAK